MLASAAAAAAPAPLLLHPAARPPLPSGAPPGAAAAALVRSAPTGGGAAAPLPLPLTPAAALAARLARAQRRLLRRHLWQPPTHSICLRRCLYMAIRQAALDLGWSTVRDEKDATVQWIDRWESSELANLVAPRKVRGELLRCCCCCCCCCTPCALHANTTHTTTHHPQCCGARRLATCRA